jgi:acyl-CoA thioester hydrolase
MSERRPFTSPLRGEVGPQGREGVATPTEVAVPPHPGSLTRSDPPPPGEGKEVGAWPHLSGHLKGDTHFLPVRVYYEDTDFSGVVYHASYLRFLERGRTDFLRVAGVAQSNLHADGEGLIFAVRRMIIDYFKPARMDDVLVVETRTAEVKGASLVILQRITRGEEVIVAAEVRVAAIAGGRPVRIPDELRTVLSGEPSRS